MSKAKQQEIDMVRATTRFLHTTWGSCFQSRKLCNKKNYHPCQFFVVMEFGRLFFANEHRFSRTRHWNSLWCQRAGSESALVREAGSPGLAMSIARVRAFWLGGWGGSYASRGMTIAITIAHEEIMKRFVLGILRVQSIILIEVSNWSSLIVVTPSLWSKEKTH